MKLQELKDKTTATIMFNKGLIELAPVMGLTGDTNKILLEVLESFLEDLNQLDVIQPVKMGGGKEYTAKVSI